MPMMGSQSIKPSQGEDVGELKEQTGKIAPLPEHDGTDCLKWDDSLWSHADHFKVCWVSRGLLALTFDWQFAN